jgi:archaellin
MSESYKYEHEYADIRYSNIQNDKQIDQTTSGNGGEFTILIPKDGEFYLTVSYPGCNTKRMSINTQNIPENISKDNFKPSFKIIGGFIMVKPYPGINYSELNQNLIRVEYLLNKKAFDDTEEGTEKGLAIVSKIYDAEDSSTWSEFVHKKREDKIRNFKEINLS